MPLGKDVDLTSFYGPKPSNNLTATTTDHTISSGSLSSSVRPLAYSVRGTPSTLQEQLSLSRALKSTKSMGENRRGNVQKKNSLILAQLILF